MKTKFITVLLALSLALGCSKSSDPAAATTIVGTWIVNSVTDSGGCASNGITSYACPATSTNPCMRYIFNADKTFKLAFTPYGSSAQILTGTYSISGDKITVTIAGSSPQVSTFVIAGNTLTLTLKDASTGCTSVAVATSDPPTATATINGKAFTASEIKVTDIGKGLQIKMASTNETITILTDDSKSGTYGIVNISGRIMAGTSCTATYYNGTDVYFSQTGTVTFTTDPSGMVSATYTITFSNSSGTVISLTNGKLTDAVVTLFQVPTGKCLIASLTKTNYGTSTFYYDNDGKLLRINHTDGTYELFIWAGGVVTNYIWISNAGTIASREKWSYTGGKLTKITVYAGSSAQDTDYTLNADGQPTSVVYHAASTSTATYLYANGNCTQINPPTNGYIQTLSNYDSKPNVASFMYSSLGVSFLPDGILTYVGPGYYSKNNIGKVVQTTNGNVTGIYVYTPSYNAQGNVASITLTANGTFVQTETYSYIGCN